MTIVLLSGIASITSMACGLIMSIFRAREPYFKFVIKRKVKECFGIIHNEKDFKDG
jgi:hypothetical protein